MTAILNLYKPPKLPYFYADFEKTCIEINGLFSTLLQIYLQLILRSPLNTVHCMQKKKKKKQ